jgi:hypothetical protein
VTITGEREDRVFFIAPRSILSPSVYWDLRSHHRGIAVSNKSWVSHSYGFDTTADDESGDEGTSFDERGVHKVYERKCEPAPEQIRELAKTLRDTRDAARAHDQIALLDAYARGASLWLGSKPVEFWTNGRMQPVGKMRRSIHAALWNLSCAGKKHDFKASVLLSQAMRLVSLCSFASCHRTMSVMKPAGVNCSPKRSCIACWDSAKVWLIVSPL